MSNIQTEINRLTQAKTDIKGVLDRLSVSYESDKLDSLASAIGSIKKVEVKQENGVITIPAGYISEEQTFVVSSDLTTGYLINGADGNVYFQAVKEVDGEIVADGDPVKVEGIEIPNTGVDAPSPVYPLPEADIVTGYIINNEDGSVYFQRVKEVDGEIANDGDPVLISEANIPETGVDEPEYVCDSPTTSGCDLYKCAAVYGPRKVTYINVSGAGTSVVNGDYEKTSLKSPDGREVWKHLTADYYYYNYDGYWCIHSDYNTWGESSLYYSWDGTEWYPGYDYGTDSPTGTDPAPTVSRRTATLDADVPKTWNGYKAVFTDGVYSFDETVTEGLTYGNGYTPVVGGVYTDGVLLSVNRLWSGTAVETPSVLYVPLSGVSANAETGQRLTYSGSPQFTVLDNIPCMFFDGSTYITVEDDAKLKEVISKQALTISFWVNIISVSSYAGLVTHCTGSRSYGIFMDSSSFVAIAQIPDERNAKNSLDMAKNNWVHVCMTAGNGVIQVYYNGIKQSNTATFDTIPEGSTALTIGGWGYGNHNGYIAAVRVFSDVLEDTDIEKLAHEFINL